MLEEKDYQTSKLSKPLKKSIDCNIELNNGKSMENGTDITHSIKHFKDFDIEISHVSAKWTDDQTTNSLENINLTVKPGRLVAIVGPVGSGKVCL